MKAISVKQPWAGLIASGFKRIETRTWSTKYRGPLLIVSSQVYADVTEEWVAEHRDLLTILVHTYPGLLEEKGKALAMVDLVDCVPMKKEHEAVALCPVYEFAWAWRLDGIHRIENPFSVKGQLGLFDVEPMPAMHLTPVCPDVDGRIP